MQILILKFGSLGPISPSPNVYLAKNLKDISSCFGLSLETFANFWRVSVSEMLVSQKKVSDAALENSVLEKSVGFGFGKFGLGEKVSVSVKILVSSFSDHCTTRFHNSFVLITWQR